MNKLRVSNKKIKILFEICDLLLNLIIAVPILPLAYLIPKNRTRIVFIGKYGGLFVDNVKYLFLHAFKNNDNNYGIYFLTENNETYMELLKKQLPVIYYPSLKGVYMMITTYVTITDNENWVRWFKYLLLFRSKKVQIWHGVPLKKIQLECPNMEFRKTNFAYRVFSSIYYQISGIYPFYDIVLSTSKLFTEKAFKIAFHAKLIIENNYPRNDILCREINNEDINELLYLGTDVSVINKVIELKLKKKKIIFYAPTFRDTDDNLFKRKALNFQRLSEFAKRQNYVFVVKSHPEPKTSFKIEETQYVINYGSTKDVYPLLPLTDMLITDYSSIYFDYLNTNKPIVFYSFDFKEYIVKDRELRFNYNEFTPGPKCFTIEQLEKEINNIFLHRNDIYMNERKKIEEVSFEKKNGRSSEEIWALIIKKFVEK